MIHCDEVFDILTRGPFPTGAASDGIVESHLAHCETCRRLAEALRPAIEMFQEAVAPEESRNLPSYWGEASPYPAPWREEASAARGTELHSASGRDLADAPIAGEPSEFKRHAGNLLRFSAAVCLGVLVAAGILRMGSWTAPYPLQPAEAGGPLAPFANVRDGSAEPRSAALAVATEALPGTLKWLANLPMNPACFDPPFTPSEAPPASGGHGASDMADQKCCTCCHSFASRRSLTRASTMQVAKACGVCH